MIVTANIVRSSGAVLNSGNTPFTLSLRLGDTIDLACAFLDDTNTIVALPDGSTGRLVLKPLDNFVTGARYLVNTWDVDGTGYNRRYHFQGPLDSQPLRDDLANNPTASYAAQIEYVINGKPYRTADIPCTVTNSYFQPTDGPPELPIGGPEAVEFDGEVWGPTEPVVTGERYAGNVNRGGNLFSVRLSVEDYQPGLEVQLKINGTTDLFTSPVAITGQTQVWAIDDAAIALSALADGDRIDVVTTWSGVDYSTACKGLQVDIALRTSTTIELDGWEWLKLRAPEANGFTHDDDAQELTVAGGGGGGATITYVGGFARVTISGTTYEWPVTEV